MKAVFLDKDGTLVDDVPYNVDPKRIMLASGAGAALRLLARLDYRLFVISNQDGIAFGRFPESSMDAVSDRLQDPANVAEAIRSVLLLPPSTVVAELTVLPMQESSWP